MLTLMYRNDQTLLAKIKNWPKSVSMRYYKTMT